MDWKDVAGVVGALAWLPHIINLAKRPKVTMVVAEQIELGFTGLGPIFNPTMAFRGENKDSLVVGVEFLVRHERGGQATFRATQLIDTAGTTQSTTGETSIHQRVSQAIAVVVGPSAVVERKVASREAGVIAESGRYINAYLAAARRLNHPALEDRVNAARQTAEAHALHEYLMQQLIWQVGRYDVHCTVLCQGQSRVWTTAFAFYLTEANVQFLRANEAGINWELRNMAFGPPEGGPNTYSWNWLYPSRQS